VKPQTYILAIDNGTQSVRAMLIDVRGHVAALAKVPITPYFSDQPGWAEQHPEYFWEAVCTACHKLWASTDLPKAAIAGVALTTQRATVIHLDAAGLPLRPAMVWLDERRVDRERLDPVRGLWGLAFRLAGAAETVAELQAEAECNWVRLYQPEIWAKTHKVLLLSGYLTHRLTGEYADSVGCQVGYLPFDYKNLRWAGPRDWKWQAVPMRPDMLPALVHPAQPLGAITRTASEATGIPAGLPLIAAAADKACEVLGAGAVAPHIACLSFGTSATVNITSHRYIEPMPLIPPFPSAVPGAYSLEMLTYRGFWMVNWFKAQFGQPEVQAAGANGTSPEAMLDELVSHTSPGADGLMLQPYWSPGLTMPDARGAIIGFSDVHTRAHVYRALIEGLAYALRDGAARIARRAGTAITEIRVAGGGSQSQAAMQITADMFGLPAARLHTYETSGLGAAIDAAVGLGWYPDIPAAIREMVRLGDQFMPRPDAHARYDELYHRVYMRMYRQLRPLYRELRRLSLP
jgi:sugar (pentulose or hexulose) kinase